MERVLAANTGEHRELLQRLEFKYGNPLRTRIPAGGDPEVPHTAAAAAARPASHPAAPRHRQDRRPPRLPPQDFLTDDIPSALYQLYKDAILPVEQKYHFYEISGAPPLTSDFFTTRPKILGPLSRLRHRASCFATCTSCTRADADPPHATTTQPTPRARTPHRLCAAVVGQFSTGKTTFVRWLLGHRHANRVFGPDDAAGGVLRAADKAETAAFTVLEDGDGPALTLTSGATASAKGVYRGCQDLGHGSVVPPAMCARGLRSRADGATP